MEELLPVRGTAEGRATDGDDGREAPGALMVAVEPGRDCRILVSARLRICMVPERVPVVTDRLGALVDRVPARSRIS